ncbi:hypothetical protein N8940_02095 [Sphingomonadaceae bacterium]|nr:hypothetical protein [Sphingomonadaceae bacterium]
MMMTATTFVRKLFRMVSDGTLVSFGKWLLEGCMARGNETAPVIAVNLPSDDCAETVQANAVTPRAY